MNSPIPIQNLYFLFCYAWQHYREGSLIDVGRVENPTAPNLFATVLINGTRHLLRRGLDRDYIVTEEDLSCLRGRVEISETIKRNLLLSARAHCRFDELSCDVTHNQILKATIKSLSSSPELDPSLRQDLRALTRGLEPVSNVRVDRTLFRRVRIHRNNRFYAFLIRVCELVHASLLPQTDQLGGRFPDILRDEKRMGNVFESFVRNFLAAEQKIYKVGRDRFNWDAVAPNPEDQALLPSMETDITLRKADRTIIIDTKFYQEALKETYRSPLKKVRSENLYQLFSYLKNMETRAGPDAEADGILLYPAVDDELDLNYEIQGHSVKIRTINLAQEWQAIRADLLQIVA